MELDFYIFVFNSSYASNGEQERAKERRTSARTRTMRRRKRWRRREEEEEEEQRGCGASLGGGCGRRGRTRPCRSVGGTGGASPSDPPASSAPPGSRRRCGSAPAASGPAQPPGASYLLSPCETDLKKKSFSLSFHLTPSPGAHL